MRTTLDRRESQSWVVQTLRYLRALRRLPPFAGTLFAAISVFAAGVAGERLSGPLHGHPYLLFFPAIILTSLLFGGGAGIVAAVLSVFCAAWLVEPVRSFRVTRANILPMVLFAVTALICAGAIELLRVATRENIAGEERLKKTQASEWAEQTRLKESVHRLRNDLAALASLLTLQSRRQPEAADALAAAANQIRALGRLHARLSQADGAAVVCSDDFLRELVGDLQAAHFSEGGVRLELEADRQALPVKTATTLGLTVNELVTNAAKYAFPNGRGVIEVSFRRQGDVDTLTVADDGVGPGDKVQGTGMGSDLMGRLAGQLGGEFRRGRRPDGRGTIATVTIPAKSITPNADEARGCSEAE
jgi:two-component sensor histidine kinase